MTRNELESELVASLIGVAGNLMNSVFFCLHVDAPVGFSFLSLVSSNVLSPWCAQMAARVLCLTCPWVSDRDFCQICAQSRFTSRFSGDSFDNSRGAKEPQSSKHTFPQGGRAKTCGMSQNASKSCRQSAIAALVFFLPDSPSDQDSGNSEISDSNDSYQSLVRIL